MEVFAIDGVDELYAGDPAAFIASRDALVKALRAEKRRDEATLVSKLRRPSVVAGALNALARTRPDDVTALLDAGAEVGRQQGAGSKDDLRAAMRARRDLVGRLTAAVVAEIGEAHRPAVASALEAVSSDPDAATDFRAGRLTAEPAAPEPFAVAFDPGDVPAPKPKPKPAPAAKQPPKPAPEPEPESEPEPEPVDLTPFEDAVAVARAEVERTEKAHRAAVDRLAAAEHALATARGA